MNISFSSLNTQFYESGICCLFTFWLVFPDEILNQYQNTPQNANITRHIRKKKPLCNTLNWGNWNSGFIKLGVQWAERDIYLYLQLSKSWITKNLDHLDGTNEPNYQNFLILSRCLIKLTLTIFYSYIIEYFFDKFKIRFDINSDNFRLQSFMNSLIYKNFVFKRYGV